MMLWVMPIPGGWFVPQEAVQVRAVVHAGTLLVCWWHVPVRVLSGAMNDQVVVETIGQVDGQSWCGGRHVCNRGLA